MNISTSSRLQFVSKFLAVAGLSIFASDAKACAPAPGQSVVHVSSTRSLATAIKDAGPGDFIQMAPGRYAGGFHILNKSGTPDNPITLCGPWNAEMSSGGHHHGSALRIENSNHWRIHGFTIKTSSVGVSLMRSSHNKLTDLDVSDIGQAAITIQSFSSGNVVERNAISHTGRSHPSYGEGVYIGTAEGLLWSRTGGQIDRSDDNQIVHNRFGPHVTAESIDVKPGATNGVIRSNDFSAVGSTHGNGRVVDIKGDGFSVTFNSGVNAYGDVMQVHPGRIGDFSYGNNNAFRSNNVAAAGGRVGFRVYGYPSGVEVGCENVVLPATPGSVKITNVRCRS